MTPAYIKFRTYTECSPGSGDAYRRVSYEMPAVFGYRRIAGGIYDTLQDARPV